MKTKAEDAHKTAQKSKKAVENTKRTLQQTRQAGRKTLEVTKKSIKSSRQIERGIKTSFDYIRHTKFYIINMSDHL